MSDALPALVRGAVEALFPWLAGVTLSAKSGGLRILSAASKALHLAGDAGDPKAITTADTAGSLLFDPGNGITGPAIYYAPPGSPFAYPVTMLAAGSTVGGAQPSLSIGLLNPTPIPLGPGSGKVTIAV